MRATPSPVWIGEVELGRRCLPSAVTRERNPGDGSARVLVRLHGEVLGFVSLPLSVAAMSARSLSAAVGLQLAAPLARHLGADGLSASDRTSWASRKAWDACRRRCRPSSTTGITVVVCTRDRPEMLRTCLDRLRSVDYAPFEVVVVDNAPSTEAARECFVLTVGNDARFRYVREVVPGLSRARNRGLAESTTKYVAFTDDDVQVDRWWLQGIAAAFAREAGAGCVTGLVPPAELDHPAQHYFDRRFSWARRFDNRVYSLGDRDGVSSLFPYSAGLFGTGANLAVDRDLMEGLGGFDEALGAGSPAGGGEELDAFVRILRAGRTIVYEPSAVVWHMHRGDNRALCRQLYTYGKGLTAFLAKYVADPTTTADILHRLPAGLRQVVRMWSPGTLDGRAPTLFVVIEALGMAAGPLAYVRGRRLSGAVPRVPRRLPAWAAS